jgi:lipid A 3-O-deacylase
MRINSLPMMVLIAQFKPTHLQKLFILRLQLVAMLNLLAAFVYGQSKPPMMVRIYEDNDFFAYQKEDGAYTNGFRIDVFYQRRNKGDFFLNPFFLQAGPRAVNTYAWGTMQVMITANDIKTEKPQSGDYPYSGSLFLAHSLYSFNPQKKYSLQTEWVVGIRGRHSYAKETQIQFHRWINNPEPLGWENQLPTALLLNLNIVSEKLIFSANKNLELIWRGEIYAGTLQNAVSLQSIIRVGHFSSPYFNNYINRFVGGRNKRLNAYFQLNPKITLTANNTLLGDSLLEQQAASQENYAFRNGSAINEYMLGVDTSFVFSYGKIGFSTTYKISSGMLENQPMKAVGNISIYCRI